MYLVIGYKDTQEDYCRGCHMGTFRAETAINKFKTPEEVAEFIAIKEALDYDNRCDDWNWTVITSKCIDDPEITFFDNLESGDIHEDILAILPEIRKSERERIAKIKKEQKLAEKVRLEQAQQLLQKTRDEEEFKRLKEKLGK